LYQGKTVVVLGAAGFIGRWVARALSDQKADLYLIVRERAPAERIFLKYQVSGEIVVADLSRPEVIESLFQKLKPLITFNLAGYGIDRSENQEDAAHQINSHLVELLCQMIAGNKNSNWSGQDLVHVGSALEYGSIGGHLAEDSIPHPTTLYGKTKLAGTNHLSHYCRKHGLHAITTRLFTIYGPGEHQGRLMPSLIETARTGRPLNLTSGAQKRDFTYVEDVAEGILRLGGNSALPGDVVNMATGRLDTVRHFVEVAAQILNIPREKLLFGALPPREEEMEHAPVTLERLKRLTDWMPSTNIGDGIRKTWGFESQSASTRFTA
jgi:nucleoside-diphosphate-sugar epimerase